MLQDAERGKPLEVEAILGVTVEIGERLGLSIPHMKAVLALGAHERPRAAAARNRRPPHENAPHRAARHPLPDRAGGNELGVFLRGAADRGVNAGALGVIAAGPMRAADFRSALADIKGRTGKPWAVNIPLYTRARPSSSTSRSRRERR